METNNWKVFCVADIFPKLKIKKYSSKPKSEGNVAFISSTSTNNGVSGYVGERPSLNFDKYACCISVSTNGECFDCFYHDYPICASSDVEILHNQNLNKEIGIFVCTVLKLQKGFFSYGYKPKRDTIFKQTIKLPAKNGLPDWKYMEEYIKNLQTKEKNISDYSSCFNNEKYSLNTTNWKEFRIGDFFEISRGERIVRERDYFLRKTNEYCFPVITTRTTNNGLDGYYDKFNCPGNSLVCGGEATGMKTFYQANPCWVMDRSRILKSTFAQFNKYIAFFFLPILEQNMFRFSYGFSANPNYIKEISIKLPVDEHGHPDWKYMENYIKSLPYSKYL